jgi:K+-sensing histidine kinase KdpD
LSVISLLLVVYLITKFQTRRLNKRNALLEEKVKEKTLELVEKNEELTGTLFDLENSITDLNAAMDHLQQSNIFKSRLIGVIGQDVMVPLRYISKVSAQLKDHHDKLSRETTLESLGEISTSSRQLQFFGESILHWIKLQDNEYIPLAEKCMLHQMVDELVSFHSPLLAEKKNTVINDIPADLQFVQDPVLLRIIFNNLLLYISKFVSNGEIRINAANEKGILTLSLKDNGKGIPADKIQALNNLEPVRSSLGTIMESGWGMGYILITDLVKFSNGRLLAVSNEKDGTCIQLIIPELNNEPPGYTE